MKTFIAACAVFAIMLGVTVTSDVYCYKICKSIEQNVESGTAESSEKALKVFKRNEFLLKISVDNGYVVEAKVSLESLVAAYECNDEYEITRYVKDAALRIERVRRALII